MSYNHQTQDDDPVEGQATCGYETDPGEAPSSDKCSGFPHHNGESDCSPGDPSSATTRVATADQPHPTPRGARRAGSTPGRRRRQGRQAPYLGGPVGCQPPQRSALHRPAHRGGQAGQLTERHEARRLRSASSRPPGHPGRRSR